MFQHSGNDERPVTTGTYTARKIPKTKRKGVYLVNSRYETVLRRTFLLFYTAVSDGVRSLGVMSIGTRVRRYCACRGETRRRVNDKVKQTRPSPLYVPYGSSNIRGASSSLGLRRCRGTFRRGRTPRTCSVCSPTKQNVRRPDAFRGHNYCATA